MMVTSLMLLGNIYLLVWDYNRLKFIILAEPGVYVDQSTTLSMKKYWAYIGILLGIAISIFRATN
jgi:hypothetical protein